MKLLKLKLYSEFRGLPKGFQLSFREHNETEKDILEPICLVGLNGSGKSNTLEAICEIFYYLELKSIADEDYLKKLNQRYQHIGFEIEYTITAFKWNAAFSRNPNELFKVEDKSQVRVSIIKEPFQEAEYYHLGNEHSEHSVIQSKVAHEILPTNVIGYSSGQNELISNPFIKLDYFYFEEMLKKTKDDSVDNTLPLNRMFFMDYDSNELILLTNYLFDKTLDPQINKKVRIDRLHSFSIRIQGKDYDRKPIEFLSELNLAIEGLKQCATTWQDNEENVKSKNVKVKHRIVELSFYTDGESRKAFQAVFKHPYELFRILYLFRLMNIHCYRPSVRSQIKDAPQGTNLSNLIPKPAAQDLVFKIDNIKFKKTGIKEPISYRSLSDGEHQLLHIFGSLSLIPPNDSLFILDEPETHFNPEWRANMIKLIMKSNKFKDDLIADHFITSHSPFIISDCKPNNVYIFNKRQKKITVKTAHEKRLNTFGTSVNVLTEEIFNQEDSQGEYSLGYLNKIKNRTFKTLDQVYQAMEDARLLGDSVEKTMLFRKLLMEEERLKKGTND